MKNFSSYRAHKQMLTPTPTTPSFNCNRPPFLIKNAARCYLVAIMHALGPPCNFFNLQSKAFFTHKYFFFIDAIIWYIIAGDREMAHEIGIIPIKSERLTPTVLASDPSTRLLGRYKVKKTGKNCPNYTIKEEMHGQLC